MTEKTSEVDRLLSVGEFIGALIAGIEDGSWTKEQKMLISADPEGNRYVGFTAEVNYSITRVEDDRFAPKTRLATPEERNAVVVFPMFEIDPEF